MQVNKNIAISDSGFIFNPSSGDSFSANPIGLEIIRILKEGKPKEAVLGELLEKYTVDASTLEKDVNDFLQMLSMHQLIQYDEQ
ncbi:MAG: PqqD family protein [Sphingobacteriales bacterium]|nr:PqqD family protein [Sphingobacteriales bacterium]